MTERTRALVEEKIRLARDEIARGGDLSSVVSALTHIFPLCVDRRSAHAHVERAFEEFHLTNPDLEIDPTTIPFVRPDVA